jgi:hypothetical protein
MNQEQKFYETLKNLFVGAKIEGESGYINLMKIKSTYYEKNTVSFFFSPIKVEIKFLQSIFCYI